MIWKWNADLSGRDENQSNSNNHPQSTSSSAAAAATARPSSVAPSKVISPRTKENAAINLDESIMLDPRKIYFDSYREDEYEVDDFN